MERNTGLLIKQIDEALQRRANAQLAEIGLTLSQINVLFFLETQDYGEATFKQVERSLMVSQPTVVGLIKRLEEKGFVATAPSSTDQRAKVVALTASGRDVCARGREFMSLEESVMAEGMSADEARQLDELLSKVLSNLTQGRG